jgi:hypothetical protein
VHANGSIVAALAVTAPQGATTAAIMAATITLGRRPRGRDERRLGDPRRDDALGRWKPAVRT